MPVVGYGQPGHGPAPGFNTSSYPPQSGYDQIGFQPQPSMPSSAQTEPPSVIVQQPGHHSTPGGVQQVPHGLEYLTAVDQLLVQQQVELAEVLFSFETENKYQVKNSLGQQVYFAKENTNCCNRNCLGSKR